MPKNLLPAKDEGVLRKEMREDWLKKNVIGKEVRVDGKFDETAEGGKAWLDSGLQTFLGVKSETLVCIKIPAQHKERFLEMKAGSALRVRGKVESLHIGEAVDVGVPLTTSHLVYLSECVIP